jgi:hypothetical protein
VTVAEALDALLGSDRTGDMRADLVAGAREAMDRRERNTEHGGAVIAALRATGMSWRDVEVATGIPAHHRAAVGRAAGSGGVRGVASR